MNTNNGVTLPLLDLIQSIGPIRAGLAWGKKKYIMAMGDSANIGGVWESYGTSWRRVGDVSFVGCFIPLAQHECANELRFWLQRERPMVKATR